MTGFRDMEEYAFWFGLGGSLVSVTACMYCLLFFWTVRSPGHRPFVAITSASLFFSFVLLIISIATVWSIRSGGEMPLTFDAWTTALFFGADFLFEFLNNLMMWLCLWSLSAERAFSNRVFYIGILIVSLVSVFLAVPILLNGLSATTDQGKERKHIAHVLLGLVGLNILATGSLITFWLRRRSKWQHESLQLRDSWFETMLLSAYERRQFLLNSAQRAVEIFLKPVGVCAAVLLLFYGPMVLFIVSTLQLAEEDEEHSLTWWRIHFSSLAVLSFRGLFFAGAFFLSDPDARFRAQPRRLYLRFKARLVGRQKKVHFSSQEARRRPEGEEGELSVAFFSLEEGGLDEKAPLLGTRPRREEDEEMASSWSSGDASVGDTASGEGG